LAIDTSRPDAEVTSENGLRYNYGTVPLFRTVPRQYGDNNQNPFFHVEGACSEVGLADHNQDISHEKGR
jgi:hypothetical protein